MVKRWTIHCAAADTEYAVTRDGMIREIHCSGRQVDTVTRNNGESNTQKERFRRKASYTYPSQQQSDQKISP